LTDWGQCGIGLAGENLEMKKLLVEDKNEGLLKLLGERVTLFA